MNDEGILGREIMRMIKGNFWIMRDIVNIEMVDMRGDGDTVMGD